MDRNEVVIVTGAGRGIGRGVVEAVLREGGVAVALDPDAAALAELFRVEEGGRGRLELHTLDVMDRVQVRQVFNDVAERHGRIDALVNAAGTSRPASRLAVGPEDADDMIRLLLKGMFLCTTAAVPHMLKCRRGKVITIASGAGRRGRQGTGPRATGEGGVIAFTRRLGRELASHGIRVNAVALSAAGAERALAHPTTLAGPLGGVIPIGLPSGHREVVAAIMFLVSPAGDAYCGQILFPGHAGVAR